MDVEEQVRLFQEFVEERYYAQLLEESRKGNIFFVIDFFELTKFNTELAEELLERPEEILKAGELAIKEFDLPKKSERFYVRIRNLPESQKILLSEIRSEHLGKFMWTEGIVRQKSDVRPHVTASKFECPSCGNILTLLQLEKKFREPTRCGCGRKGKFKEISKELVDGQGLVLEEAPEDLEGGTQPKRMNVLLKNDLVSPVSERNTAPGNKVRVMGWVSEVPINLRSGGQSTKFDLMVEANNIEPVDEDYTRIEITPEEMKQIEELAKDPAIYDRLIGSLAPSIYGHEKIKEALLLQMVGGVKKERSDGTVTRGDMHVLLIGDPGCIAGDSRVALYHKGMKPIQTLGTRHLQPLRELVTVIRKSAHHLPYDYTSNFQIYRNQPTLKIMTETGKQLVCTYNQPLLTPRGWCRADHLSVHDTVRVMPKIPNFIKACKKTGFAKVPKSSGKLKENLLIPASVTPELAGLFGYIIGDGNVHPKGYRITCYINEEEKDLIPKLTRLWKNTFNVGLHIPPPATPRPKKIVEAGQERIIKSQMPLHILEVNSRQVATNLHFLGEKRVPPVIFESPKRVIKAFLQWLFEADGCSFGKGRGRTSIQLKSSRPQLLSDVQLLLLYFGIQSRIIEDNLCIRRSKDMETFAAHIGFVSEKKQKKLKETLKVIHEKSKQQKRKTAQRYEKIVSIAPDKNRDVYDFEVPKTHTFIANGMVCHNSGKSALLKRIIKVAPKARYASGKGASGAGLTAAVVKDEFLGGWSLEAGTLVLAHKGFCAIDELDKMSREDQSALHEGLEQQTISISKANIQATLRCETTVLAAANPKFGRFDQYESIAPQINLPPALINRFDLIFPIKDLPDKTKDEEMATHILNLHQNPEALKAEIPTELLKKYIAYARQKMNPRITDAALKELKEFYLKMRSSGSGDESGVKSIPITARQLEALVRLSEGVAKVRLSQKITKKDAQRAVDLLTYCLGQVALDAETGKIDIDRISSGISASQRSKISMVKEIITTLEAEFGKTIPIEHVVKLAEERNVKVEEVEEILDKLRRSGDVFEPKRGFIQKL